MSEELRNLIANVRKLLTKATGGDDRPLPWKVWTSNSFRRVKTAGGRDGLDVLSAYAQRSDGCLDLSMPEDRLIALVDLLNALPALIDHLEADGGSSALTEKPLDGMTPRLADRIARESAGDDLPLSALPVLGVGRKP